MKVKSTFGIIALLFVLCGVCFFILRKQYSEPIAAPPRASTVASSKLPGDEKLPIQVNSGTDARDQQLMMESALDIKNSDSGRPSRRTNFSTK